MTYFMSSIEIKIPAIQSTKNERSIQSTIFRLQIGAVLTSEVCKIKVTTRGCSLSLAVVRIWCRISNGLLFTLLCNNKFISCGVSYRVTCNKYVRLSVRGRVLTWETITEITAFKITLKQGEKISYGVRNRTYC
jgi:hypothetical protein